MIRKYLAPKALTLALVALLLSAFAPGAAHAIPKGGCCAKVNGGCATICNEAGGCTGNGDCDVATSIVFDEMADALISVDPGDDREVHRRLSHTLGYWVEELEPLPLKLEIRTDGGRPAPADDFFGNCPTGTSPSPFDMPIYDEETGLFVIGFETVWFCIPDDLEPAG